MKLSLGLTLNCAAAIDEGAAGNPLARSFIGSSSQSLEVTDSAALRTGDVDFAVACWVKLDSLASNQGVLAKGTSTGAAGHEWYLSWVNAIGAYRASVSDGVTTKLRHGSAGQVTAGQWHLVVLQHDSVNNLVKLKVDLNNEVTVSKLTGSWESNHDVTAGKVSTSYMTGGLSRLGYWKGRILSDSDIASLYNSGSGLLYSELSTGLKTGLVDYWDLTEVSGNATGADSGTVLTDNNGVGSMPGPG